MKRTFLVIAITLSAGCATSYQSKGIMGGYSETQLTPDTFIVDFSGNGYTSAERASDFAILRAADKSEELGCDHFAIMNGKESSSSGAVTISSSEWRQNNSISTGSILPFNRYDKKLVIKCFKGNPPKGIQAFDVAFIQHSLKEKYKIK